MALDCPLDMARVIDGVSGILQVVGGGPRCEESLASFSLLSSFDNVE